MSYVINSYKNNFEYDCNVINSDTKLPYKSMDIKRTCSNEGHILMPQ